MASRFVDSPLLEDEDEDLPEVPSRLEDYDDEAALDSTKAHLEAKYPEVTSQAASKASSRNSTYGAAITAQGDPTNPLPWRSSISEKKRSEIKNSPIVSREATFDVDERLRQLQQEEEASIISYPKRESSFTSQKSPEKPFSYLSPEPSVNPTSSASASPSMADLGALKYQPPAVRKLSNVSSTHRMSFGSNTAAEAPAAVGTAGGTDEGYLGSVSHSNFTSTEEQINLDPSSFDDPYKPLANMFSGTGGGESSYLSDYPLTNSDLTDPDLVAEERYQENLKKRMEAVQQDMKSFGIDGTYKAAQQKPSPQSLSRNEDFDPSRDYATDGAHDAAYPNAGYGNSGGYTDFSNFGSYGSEDPNANSLQTDGSINYAADGASNYATDGASHYATDGASDYATNSAYNFSASNAESGAGFGSFLDANSDFSFFTSSFDGPVPDAAATDAQVASAAATTTTTTSTLAATPNKSAPGKTPEPKTKTATLKTSNSTTPNSKKPNSKTPNSKTPNSKTPNGKSVNGKTPSSKSPTKPTPKSKSNTGKSPHKAEKEKSAVRPESDADSVFLRSGSLKQQGLSGKRSRNPSGVDEIEKEGSFNSSTSQKSSSEEAWERSQARAKSILGIPPRKYSSVQEIPEDLDTALATGAEGTPKITRQTTVEMMKERTPPTPKMSPRPPISEKSGASTPTATQDDVNPGAFITEDPLQSQEPEEEEEEDMNLGDSLEISDEAIEGDEFALVPVENEVDSATEIERQSQLDPQPPNNATIMAQMQQQQQLQQQLLLQQQQQQMMIMPQWPGQIAQPAFTQPLQMSSGFPAGMPQMPVLQQMPQPIPQMQPQIMVPQPSFAQQPMVGQVGVGPQGQPIYGYLQQPAMPMIMGAQQMSFVQQSMMQPSLQQPSNQTAALSPRRSQSELSNSSIAKKQPKSQKSTLGVVDENAQQRQQQQLQPDHGNDNSAAGDAANSMPKNQSENILKGGPLPNYPSIALNFQQQQPQQQQRLSQGNAQQQWNQPWANDNQQWQMNQHQPWQYQQQQSWQHQVQQQVQKDWSEKQEEERQAFRPGYPEMKPKGKTDESMKKFVNRMKKVYEPFDGDGEHQKEKEKNLEAWELDWVQKNKAELGQAPKPMGYSAKVVKQQSIMQRQKMRRMGKIGGSRVLSEGDLNKLSEGQRGYSDSTIYQKEAIEEAADESKSAGLLGQSSRYRFLSQKNIDAANGEAFKASHRLRPLAQSNPQLNNFVNEQQSHFQSDDGAAEKQVTKVDLDISPQRRIEGWASNMNYDGHGDPLNRLQTLPPIQSSKEIPIESRDEDEGYEDEDDKIDLGESASRRRRNASEKSEEDRKKGNGTDRSGREKKKDAGGSYLQQLEERKKPPKKFKKYTLKDYRAMQRDVQLGGLGPDYEGESYRDKADKLQRAQEYAVRVKAANKQKAEVAQFKKQFEGASVASRLPKGGYVASGGEPHASRGPGSGNSGTSGSVGASKPRLIAANGLTDDQKQEQARKRAQMAEYAKQIPKPKVAPPQPIPPPPPPPHLKKRIGSNGSMGSTTQTTKSNAPKEKTELSVGSNSNKTPKNPPTSNAASTKSFAQTDSKADKKNDKNTTFILESGALNENLLTQLQERHEREKKAAESIRQKTQPHVISAVK